MIIKYVKNIFKKLFILNLIILLIVNDNNFKLVHGKSLEHLQDKSCENVKQFFEILNITLKADSSKTGAICDGHCCNDKTEDELMVKSTNNFERLLRHHTRSLRGTLESTASQFRDHVLELTRQSENKTLNLFSQVYRKMSPLSRQPILELYDSIRSYLSSNDVTDNLENVVNRFFIDLFPVAYHHAVHTSVENITGDFHIDYKTCLKHVYSDLQPFGEIPKELMKSLSNAVGSASIFLKSLDRAAEVLANTEELDTEYLSSKCKTHLLKMSYCPECKGISKQKVKTCSAYCLNVLRGCLAQYVGSLDSPWSSFAVAIERLINLVRSKDGIESVIKTLDAKLSETIMHAMVNGPTLEKKVKVNCGAVSLVPTMNINDESDLKPQNPVTNKWVSPPDTQLLYFLATIDKSKDLYSKIVDSLCEDEEFKKDDRNCWTGSHVSEYSQPILPTSAQKYNPEVPYEATNTLRATKLTELSDKLIELQRKIASAYLLHSENDNMQSDMAEEGSGWNEDSNDDLDDYGGSGSGGGRGNDVPQVVDVSTIHTLRNNNVQNTPHGKTSSCYKFQISLSLIFSSLLSVVVFKRTTKLLL